MMTTTAEYFREMVPRQAAFFEQGAGTVAPCFITVLEVELSNYCNLACPFCYTRALKRKRGHLPFEAFERLVDHLDGKGLKPRISFSGDGEIFMHPRILDFVACAKSRRFHVQIITNGLLCTPDKSQALVDLGLDRVQFSLDSINPETYLRMRKPKSPTAGRNNFATAMRHALEYARINYEAGEPTTISVMAVETSLNRGELPDFRRFWESLPVHNVYVSPLYTLGGNAARVFPEAEAAKYAGAVDDKPICVCPFILMCIKSDGTVLACTHDSEAVYPLGNIIEDGPQIDVERTVEIERLWNGERIQRLREALLRRDTAFFGSIALDCPTCNCPLGDGSIEAYRTGLNSPKVTKIWASMNKPRGRADKQDGKYRHLLELIEEFAPKRP